MTGPAENALARLPGQTVTGYTIDSEGLTIHFSDGDKLILRHIGAPAIIETKDD